MSSASGAWTWSGSTDPSRTWNYDGPYPIQTHSYYGADQRLRVFQKSGGNTGTVSSGVFEEYRYDALGRRVLVRSRRDSGCTSGDPSCTSTVTRYVWDGDQLLYELRSRGDYTLDDAAVEFGSGTGNYYGTVDYTHAGGIDQPLALWRSGLNGIVPHANWRGIYVAGTYVDGTSTENTIVWPGRYQDAFFAADARMNPPLLTNWLGSLADGKTDASGLQYMRNRYFDPKTGHFTQEDPIGLAGGMNLYGFAGGDPINFRDPFGLCPPRDPRPCGATGAIIGAVAGAGVGVAVTAGCASVTVGICAAAGPEVIGLSAALGGSVGGFVGTAIEQRDAIVTQMAGVKQWIKRILLGGSIWLGGGVPERVQGGEKPPQQEQPTSKEEDEKRKKGGQ